MRKFVAGFCCVVVGLQVLIGVPLAVCLVFFAVTQGGGGPVAFEAHSGNPFPATIAPPNYSGPQPYFPGSQTIGLPTANSAPPVKAAIDTPPSRTELGPWATAERAESPEVAAIVEARERIGSPLVGSILDTPPAHQSPQVELVQTLREIAADEGPSTLPPPVNVEPSAQATAAPSVASEPQQQDALLALLQNAAEQLYVLATKQEDRGNFGRADQLRQLARDIREELEMIRGEESPRPALQSSPPPTALRGAEPTSPSAAEPQKSAIGPPAN